MTVAHLTHAVQVEEKTTWIEICHSALAHNVSVVRHETLPSASLLAVVKANAYGHGLLPIARCLREEVAYLGVATIEEALDLRAADFQTPLLLFGIPSKEAIDVAIESDVTIAVSSLAQARDISRCAHYLNKPAMVHIKVDTGMGRLGIPAREAVRTVGEISELKGVKLEGLFTHFPQGDLPKDPFTRGQIDLYYKILNQLSKEGIDFPFRHAANSVGISNYKESHFNLVRPGLILYGLCPNAYISSKLHLKPVLSWKAKIILIKKLQAGDTTGYGRTFVAKEDTTLAILPVGYSHGYPYALSNKGFVLYHGKKFPVVGRVSMDYLAVDFGSAANSIEVGDTVTLLGEDSGEYVRGEELARLAGTIPYEILTRLSASIPRISVNS